MNVAASFDASHGDPLCAALAAAKARYAERRPESRTEWHSAARVMPGGNTRTILYFDPFPVCMTGGSGCSLVDVDGIRYVDLLGEYTAGIYGHSNPVIQAAVIEALRNGLSLSAHNQAEIRLASVICARYPSIELVRFTNSERKPIFSRSRQQSRSRGASECWYSRARITEVFSRSASRARRSTYRTASSSHPTTISTRRAPRYASTRGISRGSWSSRCSVRAAAFPAIPRSWARWPRKRVRRERSSSSMRSRPRGSRPAVARRSLGSRPI